MGSEIVQQNQLGQSVEWAKLVASSDIIPEAYKGKPANILIATGFGAAMGLSQAESLYRISVIKGKPTMSAELIAAQVRAAGHKLRIVKDEKKQSVTATIVRRDDPDYPISVTRDLAWAHKMGLDQPNRNGMPSNYQKQPMTMLTWRAITAVAREAAPEALYGVAYTPDEMHDSEASATQVTVHDAEPVEPEIVDSPARSRKQKVDRIIKLMQAGGCDNKDKAAVALPALLGRDITGTDELDAADIDALLSAPDMVTARTREALTPQPEAVEQESAPVEADGYAPEEASDAAPQAA